MNKPQLYNSAGTFTLEELTALQRSDLSLSMMTALDGNSYQFRHAIDHVADICFNIVNVVALCEKTQLPVAKIVKEKSPFFPERHRVHFPPKWESLEEKMRSVFQYQFSTKYSYGPEVKAWMSVQSQFSPEDLEILSFPALINPKDKQSAQKYVDLFNLFIARLMKCLGSAKYKKKIRDRSIDKQNNKSACIELFNHLIAKFARVLVIRMDFSLKRDPETLLKHAPSMAHPYSRHELLYLKCSMKKFKNNWRNNMLLNAIEGYIWQYEYSHATGFHIHAYFFYDGDKHQEDITLAQYISDYWKKVTSNRGCTYICNMQKDQYKYCGIGMIHYSDIEKQSYLFKTFDYIVKADQFFMFSELKNFKRFQRSGLPEPKANSGRPRTLITTKSQPFSQEV
ncbi:PF11726 family protein [Acinetobacter sp. WC-323]|uniref:YagK/YfjJ domain-containing protein n=1 Tax=Acinetobacter sp. WC-323 TaxID=903918 RepID=UPI00029E8B11|nr:inovirus-type Gp2 protein [Acinetobacter sp. WC-323]EKU57472.1 PF11726 family protein [Acinetobacter sp. WC-323]